MYLRFIENIKTKIEYLKVHKLKWNKFKAYKNEEMIAFQLVERK